MILWDAQWEASLEKYFVMEEFLLYQLSIWQALRYLTWRVFHIHIRFLNLSEVREHGVGYYQFSKEETERKQQMESLNKLREQVCEVLFDLLE